MQVVAENVKPILLRVSDIAQHHLGHGVTKDVTKSARHRVNHHRGSLRCKANHANTNQSYRPKDQETDKEQRHVDRRRRSGLGVGENWDNHQAQTNCRRKRAPTTQAVREVTPQQRASQTAQLQANRGVNRPLLAKVQRLRGVKHVPVINTDTHRVSRHVCNA